MRYLGWATIQYDYFPYEKRRLGHRHVKREDHSKTEGEDNHLQPKQRNAQKKATLPTH